MRYSTTLQNDLEKWWKHLDCPMSVLEGIDDIKIGDCTFRAWGDKRVWEVKTKSTIRYIRTFQSIDIVENIKGEQVYPILDVYIDICNGRKSITYKKFRCHCGC